MLLEEALTNPSTHKVLVRQFWLDHGSKMKLITSAKSLDDLADVTMTKESRDATDWVIIDG